MSNKKLSSLMGAAVELRRAVDVFIQACSEAEKQVDNVQTLMPEKALIIKQAVCNEYNIELQQLEKSAQRVPIADARHTAIYLIRTRMSWLSLKEIGKLFNGRHYSTVSASLDKHLTLYKVDEVYTNHYDNIAKELISELIK